MNLINEILANNVSYQVNTWSDISFEPTIEVVLNEIKSDKYKSQIKDLRDNLEIGNKEYYDNFKKQLPAVTFSATFSIKRTNDNLKAYNPVVVIDIDKLNSEKLNEVYYQLLKDDYVFSFWRSPSNNGYKGLIPIKYIIEEADIKLDTLHKSAFIKLSEYFLKEYNIELDKSGSDITRLCFLSHDENLIIKNNAVNFDVYQEDLIQQNTQHSKNNIKLNFTNNKDALYNPLGKNKFLDRKLMSDIIRYLKNKNFSITQTYDEWCKVAMAISNTFTFEIGLKYFLKLSSIDSEKFNITSSTNFLINCYENRTGNINFSSIIFLANQKGYKTKHQRYEVPKGEDF